MSDKCPYCGADKRLDAHYACGRTVGYTGLSYMCRIAALTAENAALRRQVEALERLYRDCRGELYNASPFSEPDEYATRREWIIYTNKYDAATEAAIKAAREDVA